MCVSPPPAQTMSLLLGATASAPMVPPKAASVAGRQVRPASSVFHTPPPTVPM
jgi:hypothetical protein